MKKLIIRTICCVIPNRKIRKWLRRNFEPYEAHDFRIDYGFSTTREHPVILDCGANIGESVTFFQRCHPKAHIFAYEADPKIYEEQLIPNLRKLGLLNESSRIKCENKAIWINEEGLNFFHTGTLSGTCIETQNSETESVHVESIRLRDLLKQFDRIDFLKMDIEGAELPVILDCSEQLDRVDRLFIEYHSFSAQPQGLSKILHILESNKFRYKITEDYNPSKQYWNYSVSKDQMDCQVKIFAIHQRLTKVSTAC